MPRIICTRPNASEEINGVKFEPIEGGMLSEEIADDVAAGFLAIDGYAVHGDTPPPAPKDDERAALLVRAEAAGLTVKGNWGIERLRKEVEDAEAKKAAGGE